LQPSHLDTLGSSCNAEWGSYELHNFPIGWVLESIHIEKTSVNKFKLSLYEMNKGVEIYNSPRPSFLYEHKED
jgi:hypothetical protein